jgi:hypothetical protein
MRKSTPKALANLIARLTDKRLRLRPGARTVVRRLDEMIAAHQLRG